MLKQNVLNCSKAISANFSYNRFSRILINMSFMYGHINNIFINNLEILFYEKLTAVIIAHLSIYFLTIVQLFFMVFLIPSSNYCSDRHRYGIRPSFYWLATWYGYHTYFKTQLPALILNIIPAALGPFVRGYIFPSALYGLLYHVTACFVVVNTTKIPKP